MVVWNKIANLHMTIFVLLAWTYSSDFIIKNIRNASKFYEYFKINAPLGVTRGSKADIWAWLNCNNELMSLCNVNVFSKQKHLGSTVPFSVPSKATITGDFFLLTFKLELDFGFAFLHYFMPLVISAFGILGLNVLILQTDTWDFVEVRTNKYFSIWYVAQNL